jgi:flagellar motility protein MotE (MotC chaperone)
MSPQSQGPTGSAGKSPRKATGAKLRLVPIVMIAVMATISIKANHLWQGLSVSFGRASQAQANNNQAGQQPPAAQNAATPAQPAGGQPPAGQPPAGQAAPATAATPAAAPQTAQVQPPAPPAAQAPASPAAPTPTGATAPGTPAPAAATSDQAAQDLLAQEQKRKLVRDPFSYTDEEVDVLQQLAKRRAELDQRARQLDEREALVKAAEQRMDQKMAELKALQATVQDLLKQRNTADEQELQSLVKVYENMKPKAAAAIFEEMDMDVLLDVISRMNERKVSPILALVNPTRAKEITYELAQRRQMPIPQ